jgi:HemY protein
MLEAVAEDAGMPGAARRRSWLALAALAEQEGDEARRARCFEAAARLP